MRLLSVVKCEQGVGKWERKFNSHFAEPVRTENSTPEGTTTPPQATYPGESSHMYKWT